MAILKGEKAKQTFTASVFNNNVYLFLDFAHSQISCPLLL